MLETPRVSAVEAEILSLLRSKEMYGLEMIRASDKLKRGTIYVTLDRMGTKGFVKSRPVDDPTASGTPRRIYSITALGQRALAALNAAAAAFNGSEVMGVA